MYLKLKIYAIIFSAVAILFFCGTAGAVEPKLTGELNGRAEKNPLIVRPGALISESVSFDSNALCRGNHAKLSSDYMRKSGSEWKVDGHVSSGSKVLEEGYHWPVTFHAPVKAGLYWLQITVKMKALLCKNEKNDSSGGYFEVRPSVSGVGLKLKRNGSRVEYPKGKSNWISVPYKEHERIEIIPFATDENADFHIISACAYDFDVSPKTRLKGGFAKPLEGGKDMEVQSEYIERGTDVTIKSIRCTLTDVGGRNTSLQDAGSLPLQIHRELPNFGAPRLQWGGDSNPKKQFDWAGGVGSGAQDLKIKVMETNLSQQNVRWDHCDITGTGTQGYSFSESIATRTNTSLRVRELGKGQTVRGGPGESGQATFSGVCYEDKTHWDYYSQRLDDITLERGAPRIIGRGDVTGKLSINTVRIRPGETFLTKADASLVSVYPHVTFTFSVDPKNPSLAEIAACEKFGLRSDDGCYVDMSHIGTQSGNIALRAASKDQIKIRTPLTVRVTAHNRDLSDVSDDIELDSKGIDIVPQITVRGRTSSAAVQIGSHPVNAANIVLHQGRQVDVALSDYRLIGDMPGGGENGQTSGELTALKLLLPAELEKTAPPKWAIAGAPLAEADAAWTGRDTATKLSSLAVNYKEDQSIKMTVPIRVTGDVAKKVKLHLSGQYATTEAEVLNPAGTNETDVAVEIGEKLLPASQVFEINVNQTVPLTLSHNAPNNLNYIEVYFNALKSVSGVDLQVNLPEGLRRGVQGELQLLKNDVKYKDTACPNSCLNNKWIGSGVIVDGLSMTQNDRFIMKIPVELASSASGALKPIEIVIEQNDGAVDQDTRERVVEWKTGDSVLKATKPVVVQSREQVAVNKLDPTLQVVNADGKTFQAVVDVMNADTTDTVTLVSGGRSFAMTRVNVNNGPSNCVRYEAASVPMLKRPDDILTVTVLPGGGNPVSETVGDGRGLQRALTCSEATTSCTLIWRGARVPYLHSASGNALGFNLSSRGKEAWFDKTYRLSRNGDPWHPVSLFQPKNYKGPALDVNSVDRDRSFLLDGTMPQEGNFHFNYDID